MAVFLFLLACISVGLFAASTTAPHEILAAVIGVADCLIGRA